MIVITGASDGLGRELSKLLIKDGKRVFGLARNKCEAGVIHIKTDLLDEASITSAVDQILKEEESLEAVINCAGVISLEKINALSSSEIERVLATNVKAPMLLVSKLMDRIQKDGSDILNVASTVGFKGYADQAAYGVSKWAMRGFSTNLQTELKDTSCRVISFCPGGFVSRFFAKVTGIENNLDPKEWMKASDLAKLMWQVLQLPKNMEVSEIIINRKTSI
ncbi:MAG TPA: SDR family NAD(P)-dependent oxidoreductase [Candidatus Dojkabacteria bacterium]|nr:SDR family NAD(P)-dependent oxidoreductase [Candidatus Dojkabacteria bacterium]